MRNTQKALIIGVLLAELGSGAYLLFHKDDESTEESAAAAKRAAVMAMYEPQSADSHVTTGSVAPIAPPVSAAEPVALAPEQTDVAREPAEPVLPASAAEQQQRAEPEPHQKFARSPERIDPKGPIETETASDAHNQVARDGVHRRAANAVAATMTDELVRQSAQLDPALPAPALVPLPAPQPQPERAGANRRGSSSVAAAMTDELVRQSAQLDPTLPPPGPTDHAGANRRSANPVAAAMTDDLVRESARIGPTVSQPAGR